MKSASGEVCGLAGRTGNHPVAVRYARDTHIASCLGLSPRERGCFGPILMVGLNI
jgi:hypothetical protein